MSFPHSRPTLHIWCKAWVPVNCFIYFLVLMFLANQCMDLYLHSHMSTRGDEEQGLIRQSLQFTTYVSRTCKNSGFKSSYSTFTSISFKTTCLQNMSDFAKKFFGLNSFDQVYYLLVHLPSKFSWNNSTPRSWYVISQHASVTKGLRVIYRPIHILCEDLHTSPRV